MGCPSNHFSCQKTRVNDLLCGIRMWAHVSFVLSQYMRLTDRRTEMFWHYMQSHGNKTLFFFPNIKLPAKVLIFALIHFL